MALQSLSCRSEARKAAIASAGAIALLHALLYGDSDDDKEVAAMVLHNLAFCQNGAADGDHRPPIGDRRPGRARRLWR